VHGYHSEMRLYHCRFPDGYLREVYYDGRPKSSLVIERTAAFEMLDPTQRVAFFDVMVALIRKVIAGEVKTGYMDRTFPQNPALKHGAQISVCFSVD
jgi:hypothetical protein